jgi:hypothetical protein
MRRRLILKSSSTARISAGRFSYGDSRNLPSRVEPYTCKILESHDAAARRAAFFMLGWVATRHPDLITSIVRAGHEIAWQGYQHRLGCDQALKMFREDGSYSSSACQAGRSTFWAPKDTVTTPAFSQFTILVTASQRRREFPFASRSSCWSFCTQRGPHSQYASRSQAVATFACFGTRSPARRFGPCSARVDPECSTPVAET